MYRFLIVLVGICSILISANELDEFDKAFKEMKAKKKLETERIANQYIDSTVYEVTPEDSTIFVGSDSVNLIIDSLQRVVNKYNTGDKYYNELVNLNTTDRIRYNRYLVNNKIKTTAEITEMYKQLQLSLQTEYDKLYLIMNYQTGNNRVRMNNRVRSKRNELHTVSSLIIAMVQ